MGIGHFTLDPAFFPWWFLVSYSIFFYQLYSYHLKEFYSRQEFLGITENFKLI